MIRGLPIAHGSRRDEDIIHLNGGMDSSPASYTDEGFGAAGDQLFHHLDGERRTGGGPDHSHWGSDHLPDVERSIPPDPRYSVAADEFHQPLHDVHVEREQDIL